jgi:sigma-E factor negative regulatory protein RseB
VSALVRYAPGRSVSGRSASGRPWRCFAWSLLALMPAAASAEDAREWLERMNRALAEQSYEGTFFHERGGHSESMRIHHRVRNGEVAERLVSLDGSGREFIRKGDELVYILPDQRAVLTERRPRRGGLLPNFPRFDDYTAQFYRLEGAQRTRLIERDARLVSLVPLDPYRYGYRVWIDARTRLPLKSELYDRSGRVLERIAFATLQRVDDIPDSTFRPAMPLDGYRRLESGGGVRLQTVTDSAEVWNVRTAPQGFRLTQRGEHLLPGEDDPVSHLVLSDGLASVSVFIGARLPSHSAKEIAVARQIGASTAFSTFLHGHHVVVVGEIPVKTARLIAAGLVPGPQGVAERPGEPARPAAPGRPGEPGRPREAASVIPQAPAFASPSP